MLIDLEQANKQFKKFVSQYDFEDGRINHKINHSYRVATMGEYIAKELKLDEENIRLSSLIGLLHDIGRLEQITKYNTFEDFESVDHGILGTQILFKDNLIREFITDNKYDTIIKKAIENHNKYKIEDDLNEIEMLHSKIVRDADKLDNFQTSLGIDFEVWYKCPSINSDTISDIIYNSFINLNTVLRRDVKTHLDDWISHIAFIFDINFICTFKLVHENDYINKLIDRIDCQNKDTKEKMERIRECANNYIIERIQ